MKRSAYLPQPDAGLSGIKELRNVLYPTDFSVDSIRALAYALSFSQKFQACLTLLHVVRGPPDNPERERLQAFFVDKLQQLVQQQAVSPCQQQFRVEFGDPTSGILRCADSIKADLIVMGVRGTGAMVRASTDFGGAVTGLRHSGNTRRSFDIAVSTEGQEDARIPVHPSASHELPTVLSRSPDKVKCSCKSLPGRGSSNRRIDREHKHRRRDHFAR